MNVSILKCNELIWFISSEQFEVLEIDNPKYFNEEHVNVRLIERPIWLTDHAYDLDVAERVSFTEAGNLLRYPVVRQAIKDWSTDVFDELVVVEEYINDGNAKAVLTEVSKLQPLAASLFHKYRLALRPLIKLDPDQWELLDSALQHVVNAHEQFTELCMYLNVIGGANND